MKGYLLDTNICIFLFRRLYDVEGRLNKIGYANVYVSDVTVAELRYGAYKSDFVAENLEIIDEFIAKVNVVPFAQGIDFYCKEKNRLRVLGKQIEDFDILIAAAALSEDLILVTDNTKHFSRIEGLVLENWIDRKNLES